MQLNNRYDIYNLNDSVECLIYRFPNTTLGRKKKWKNESFERVKVKKKSNIRTPIPKNCLYGFATPHKDCRDCLLIKLCRPGIHIKKKWVMRIKSTVESINSTRNLLIQEGIDPERYFPSCVGCGYCCLQAKCLLGVYLFDTQYPCPALKWDGERYRCQLAEEYGDDLYIGSGCCEPKNKWRKEVKKRWSLKFFYGLFQS